MWIIVAILKWIGILIGIILGMCLFLSVLVIFVPIRYRITGSYQNEPVYCFKFSWLFSMLSIKKRKHSDRILFCVFGIPVRCLVGDKKTVKKEEKSNEQESDLGSESPPSSELKEKHNSSSLRKVKIKEKRQGKNRKKRKRKKDRRKKNFSFRKVSSIIGFVKQNGKVIRRLLGEVQALFCYLLPTKVCGEMIVGTGDPASTGLMIGGLSLFPVVYQENLKITPDFEEKRFEAKGYIKGRLRMIYFVRLLLRLYKDRELKRLWKQFNQVKKEAA